MGKINRTNFADHLVEYQLGMINRSIQEAMTIPHWYSDWTMTTEQFNILREYSVPLIKKVFKCNKKRAEDIFNSWNLQFGLRIDDENQQIIEPEKL